jgi:hypothetical protein
MQTATAEAVHPPDVVTEADYAEVETLLQHAGSAYRVLAGDAALAFADASKLVSTGDRLPLRRTPTGAEPANRPTADESWGRELKPIGQQFGEALEFLWEVPPEPSPST